MIRPLARRMKRGKNEIGGYPIEVQFLQAKNSLGDPRPGH